ncbi:MAG: LysM domain-containing protein, partial [Nitrospirota bacterium]
KEIFLKNLADTPEEERFTIETYSVKKGDTIDKIAKKTGVTARAILVLNSIDKVKPLKPGTQISLPPKEKFELDRDDRFEIRKVSYKKASKKASYKKSKKSRAVKSRNKKLLVTSLNKKKNTAND